MISKRYITFQLLVLNITFWVACIVNADNRVGDRYENADNAIQIGSGLLQIGLVVLIIVLFFKKLKKKGPGKY